MDSNASSDNDGITQAVRPVNRYNRIASNNSSSGSDVGQQGEVRERRRGRYAKYSKEQKLMFLKLYEEGQRIKEAATIAGLKLGTAYFIVSKYRRDNSELVTRPRGGARRKLLTTEVLKTIEEVIEENPARTLKEIQRILWSKNINLSKSTINNGLIALKITLKKAYKEVDRMNANETKEKRREYAVGFSAWAPQERGNMVFIDEAGFNLHLRRSQARSKRNTRAVVTVPTVRGRNTTLILAMNSQGIVHHKTLSSGNCNADQFCEFLTELAQKLPDVNNLYLIMDNARIHRANEVQRRMEELCVHVKYLPPYSPQLNPSEKVFSKVKLHARNILSEPAEEHTLCDVIAHSVSTVTSTDCANYVMDMMLQLPNVVAGKDLH